MAKNNMFQQGTFSGYKVKGRCKVVSEYTHQIEQHGFRLKKPAYGRFMAILDDPALVDENDGARLRNSQMDNSYVEKAAVEFSEESGFSGNVKPAYTITNPDGLTTASKDGAYLGVNQLTVNAGQAVLIRWDFLIGQNNVNNPLGLNDFALVDIVDAENKLLIKRQILSQTLDIPDGCWSTGWRSFVWPFAKKTKVNVSIVVCNGYSYSDDNPYTAEQIGDGSRSFPSGLLIDCVTVI
ncbi:hypothetical protein MCAMS1_00254 [biofilm metagenome]